MIVVQNNTEAGYAQTVPFCRANHAYELIRSNALSTNDLPECPLHVATATENASNELPNRSLYIVHVLACTDIMSE